MYYGSLNIDTATIYFLCFKMSKIIYNPYNLEDATARIENIIKMELSDIKALDKLPSNDELNNQAVRNTNGSVVCVKYKINFDGNEGGMKMLRLVASEFYNILISHKGIRDIKDIDDKFVALYDTPLKSDIDSLLEMVAKINAVTNFFNYRMKSDTPREPVLKVTMAMHYSRLVICRLGTADINNESICYRGQAVKQTLKLVEDNEINATNNIYVTDTFFNNLKKEYQDFFTEENDTYVASVVNTAINNWVNK